MPAGQHDVRLDQGTGCRVDASGFLPGIANQPEFSGCARCGATCVVPATIGVEPHLHCVGLDSALLADTLRRCDQEHLPGLSGIEQPRQHRVVPEVRVPGVGHHSRGPLVSHAPDVAGCALIRMFEAGVFSKQADVNAVFERTKARRIGQVDWKSVVPIAALRYHGSVLLEPLTSGLGAKLGKAEQGRDQHGWQYVAPCQAEARRDDDGFQSGRDCEKS